MTYTAVAAQLGVSITRVAQLVGAGLLEVAPGTRDITAESVQRELERRSNPKIQKFIKTANNYKKTTKKNAQTSYKKPIITKSIAIERLIEAWEEATQRAENAEAQLETLKKENEKLIHDLDEATKPAIAEILHEEEVAVLKTRAAVLFPDLG